MSSDGDGLYRERALAHGDVREALDERVRVVSVPRWTALALGLLVIAGLIAWAAAKEVRTTVTGAGVIAPATGLHPIEAPVSGTVVQPPPPGGTRVRAGQVVSTLDTGATAPVAVRAAASGSLANVGATAGSYLAAGSQIATILPDDPDLVGLVFVDADQGAALKPGMPVQLHTQPGSAGDTTRLKGEVAQVATQPVSPERLRLLVGTARAAALANGPPLDEVRVRLQADPSTPTGQAGTTGDGPDQLDAGTAVDATLVVRQQSAFSYAF